MSRYFDRELHTSDGSEGLPPFPAAAVGALVEESDANDEVYLFTCVNCGHREANPPAPLSGCSCGGDVVCHVFDYTEYNRIRWYDDPREKDFDGGEHDPEIMTDGGREVDAVSVLAERMAEDLCLGFRWHDQRDRERAVEAFARVDVLQFPHAPASEAREAARAYVDALWAKDAIEADCIPDGEDEPDVDQLAAADWSGVEDAFAERAYRVGIDELYAAASTLAWKRHKIGGDYWTPMLRAQRAELRAATQNPDYPVKSSDGEHGFGPEAVRYLLGVELHDQHTRAHWRQAKQAMVPYFKRILRSHEHHQPPAIEEDASEGEAEAEAELVTDGGQDVSACFARLAELAEADGDVPDDGSGIDGIWTRTVPAPERDREWQVAINAESEPREAAEFPSQGDTTTVPPFKAVVFLGRWPAGVVGPYGGELVVEQIEATPTSIEDELLYDIETALIEAGADIERTVWRAVSDGGEDDEWRPSCYDCGREVSRRNLQPHPIHIEHEDGSGYDVVDVPLCPGCRKERLPTHECPRCGEEYIHLDRAVECCQHRLGRPMSDGGTADLPPPKDGADPWCTWCDEDFDDPDAIWMIEGRDDSRWPAAFCSEHCAHEWGCAADHERVFRVDDPSEVIAR